MNQPCRGAENGAEKAENDTAKDKENLEDFLKHEWWRVNSPALKISITFLKKNEPSKDASCGMLRRFIRNVLKILVEAGGIEPPSEDI
jgi:hypothetical protein